jgi:alpha-tubulin suppressor-like RCC1 family protein
VLCLVILGAAQVCGRELSAQSWMRTWGGAASDTRAHERHDVKRIAAAQDATVLLMRDDSIYFQGSDGYRIDQLPGLLPGQSLNDVRISGTYGNIGLLNDGNLISWGVIWTSQVQPPTTFMPPVPALPPGTIYVGCDVKGHAIALRSDGGVVAWGPNNVHGQLTVPSFPVAVTKVRAGLETSFALLDDGSIVVWGDNSDGQYNVPSLPPSVRYVDVREGGSWSTQTNAGRHCVAMRSDGHLVAWGDNGSGQCNVPALPPGTRYELFAAGWGFTVAVRSDGALLAWGDNSYEQTNVPDVPAGLRVQQVEAGYFHALALLSNGRVLGWGRNGLDPAYVPSLVEHGRRPHDHWTSVDRGACSLATVSGGRLVAFGDNSYGQRDIPAAIRGARVLGLAAGGWHNAVVTDAGELWCWGRNLYGECSVPLLPAGLRYTKAVTGFAHTAALRSDGTGVAFGLNASGECDVPPLPAGVRYVDVCAYDRHTVWLRSDNQLVERGQWQPPNTVFGAPALPAGVDYVAVDVGWVRGVLLRSDGLVEYHGAPPFSGHLNVPVPALPFGVRYVEVAMGDTAAVARRSDGEVVVFGNSLMAVQVEIPPRPPSTSYVGLSAHLRTITALGGPTSTYVSFVDGCAGSRPPSRLVPRDTPRTGRTLDVRLFDVPMNVAVMVMGFDKHGPTPLGVVGMPGCTWHVRPDAAVVVVGQNAQAVWQLPIPDVASLVGVRFYNQALVLDTAAGNTLGAVEAVVGLR